MTRQRLITAIVLLLALIAVVALRLYNRRETERVATGSYIPRPVTVTPEMRLLQDYVRIDTSNPPGNELAGARWLAAQLEKGGVKPEIIESAPGRANVYARIRGKQPGEGLMLLNHIDVVPVNPKQWVVPPFEGRMSRSLLFGRGTLDMKGPAVCELLAFVDIARSGRQPERDLVFLAVADEETGGRLGMQWLLAHRPDLFQGLRYVLNEGGSSEMVEEKLNYIGIEIGSKILITTRLRAPRREQLQQARIAIEPYFDSDQPDRVLPEVRRYLAELSPRRVENAGLLDDVNRTIAAGKFWLVPRALRELTQNSVWPEGVQAEGDGYAMTVTLFNLPDENPAARIEWLRRTVAPFGVSVGEVEGALGPVPFSSVDTPLFGILRTELQREYGPVPVGTNILPWASTDCRFLRPRGFQCYGMWPFPVDVFQTKGIHRADEMIHLDWFAQGIRTMRNIVRSWAYGQ
jgi:acetylornithine deacetylase/succinyl-diaminopimelate desuccinylase-like protein